MFPNWQTLFVAVLVVSTPSTCSSYASHSSPAWSTSVLADPDTIVPIKFALAQANLHNLDAYLLDISDPSSPNYGQHWTPSEVAGMFKPSQGTIDAVRSWLLEEGVPPHRIELVRGGDAIQLNATVEEVERMLEVEYYALHDHDSGDVRVGCRGSYRVPEHISKHVDYVWPPPLLDAPAGVATPLYHRKRSNQALQLGRASGPARGIILASELNTAGCDNITTLDCIHALYDYNYTFVASDKNSAAVFERQGEFFLPSDLDMFFEMYAPGQVGNRPVVIGIQGGHETTSGDVTEASLDIELMMGLLDPKLPLKLYQVQQINDLQDPFDVFLGALDGAYCDLKAVSQEGIEDCGDKPLANVISISYALNPDIQDAVITPILERQCAEFGKLSLTGTTFIASSGDGGVSFYGTLLDACLVANGTLVENDPPNSTFVSGFPATCPYVTSVGATAVALGNGVQEPEIASYIFNSGGGFSNTFARPSFQESVVDNYLNNFAPPYAPDVFNRSGRAHPDIAANGGIFTIAVEGEFALFVGTSGSAPIVASFIVAVNDARLAVGKKPVGWINPALYSQSFAHVYHDITEGSNPGCSTDGFPTAPGWDPVTGLGTPDFPKMLAAFMALP